LVSNHRPCFKSVSFMTTATRGFLQKRDNRMIVGSFGNGCLLLFDARGFDGGYVAREALVVRQINLSRTILTLLPVFSFPLLKTWVAQVVPRFHPATTIVTEGHGGYGVPACVRGGRSLEA
jgi:hypothetical protein